MVKTAWVQRLEIAVAECVMVSWLRVGGWYMYCRQRDNEYKTKGRSKIKTANIKEIPRISPCDVDCGVIVGLDCR